MGVRTETRGRRAPPRVIVRRRLTRIRRYDVVRRRWVNGARRFAIVWTRFVRLREKTGSFLAEFAFAAPSHRLGRFIMRLGHRRNEGSLRGGFRSPSKRLLTLEIAPLIFLEVRMRFFRNLLGPCSPNTRLDSFCWAARKKRVVPR